MAVSPTSGWLDCPALLAGRPPARTRPSLRSDIAPFPRARLRCSASCNGAELPSTRPSMACISLPLRAAQLPHPLFEVGGAGGGAVHQVPGEQRDARAESARQARAAEPRIAA